MQQVNVKVDEYIKKALLNTAEARGVTKSEVVREAIVAYLLNDKNKSGSEEPQEGRKLDTRTKSDDNQKD